nr:interferon-inducible GTPase 5-like [Caretta caretta]
MGGGNQEPSMWHSLRSSSPSKEPSRGDAERSSTLQLGRIIPSVGRDAHAGSDPASPSQRGRGDASRSPRTPAWDERRLWEKPKQPKFSRGKSPAREKVPRNIARKPSKKGRRLGSDGDSADSWSDKFTSEASDFSEVDSAWQEDGGLSQKTRCRIALLGQTGAGKSSFVNAIRGLGDEEEGAAKTGVVETTMVPTSYRLPKQPNITIWDLPGFGPTKRQSDTDLDLFSLSQYDAFLIFSSHHFTATHAGLARKIQRAGKVVYFVRSKVDQELLPARRHQPSTYNEERILQKIRDTCMTHLQREGVTSPQVFLLSSFEYGRHDFPLLEEILQREFGSRFPG